MRPGVGAQAVGSFAGKVPLAPPMDHGDSEHRGQCYVLLAHPWAIEVGKGVLWTMSAHMIGGGRGRGIPRSAEWRSLRWPW